MQISSVGKFLDQPILTAKLNKNIPVILSVGSAGFVANEVYKAPEDEKKKTGIKTSIILGATGISAVMAPKIASIITGRKNTKNVTEIIAENSKNINEYLSNSNVSKDIEKILNKAKNSILSLKEVSFLKKNVNNDIFDKIIPPPDNISAKDIFKEIGWLSIYGALPVAGGITGGIVADKITEPNWKEKVPNKIKEGIYQYLANIFLCNIGAGVALAILEKCNIHSKGARCLGMIGGILATGVIGGSAIANVISKKLINPLLSPNDNDTRTPELVDLGLHSDDIATISLLSGLKWIEPSLPLLYSVSGYRAGIGYRNNNSNNKVDDLQNIDKKV